MFLVRLMHLSSFKEKDDNFVKNNFSSTNENYSISEFKKDTISQMKSVSQEKKNKPIAKTNIKTRQEILIESLDQLLNVCIEKKEMKLKYELEKNVNLVSFHQNRSEISFNENLDKDFVKDLS